MRVDRRKLAAALAAETAADGWWNGMSDQEKKAYLEAHPNSKYGNGGSGASIADHLKRAPETIRQKYGRLRENTRNAVADWHGKSAGEKAAAVGNGVKSFGATALHHARHQLEHEVHTYKGAAHAVKHLASGGKWKDLEPHHRKALKTALVHAGLTAASMAAGDPTGHGHATVGNLLGEFATHHAEHSGLLAAGETALKTGHHYLRRAMASGEHKMTPREEAIVKKVADDLARANIPTSVWIEVLHEVERRKKEKPSNQNRDARAR